MTDSLRDQLLGLGFKPTPKPKPPRQPGGGKAGNAKDRPPTGAKGRGAQKPGQQAKHKGGKPSGEMDLAKAYAIRSQKEKQERIEAERQKQEEARLRREARAKLQALLEGKALNADNADIVRHFPYGGKIKRIYVTEAQLKQLNAGEFGVVQQNGRYLLVDSAVLAQAEAVFPQAVALKIDPDAPVADDPYGDPKYQVPDDLVW